MAPLPRTSRFQNFGFQGMLHSEEDADAEAEAADAAVYASALDDRSTPYWGDETDSHYQDTVGSVLGRVLKRALVRQAAGADASGEGGGDEEGGGESGGGGGGAAAAAGGDGVAKRRGGPGGLASTSALKGLRKGSAAWIDGGAAPPPSLGGGGGGGGSSSAPSEAGVEMGGVEDEEPLRRFITRTVSFTK